MKIMVYYYDMSDVRLRHKTDDLKRIDCENKRQELVKELGMALKILVVPSYTGNGDRVEMIDMTPSFPPQIPAIPWPQTPPQPMTPVQPWSTMWQGGGAGHPGIPTGRTSNVVMDINVPKGSTTTATFTDNYTLKKDFHSTTTDSYRANTDGQASTTTFKVVPKV